MSFMEAILQPLLRTMLKVTPEMVTLVSNLRRTYSMWSQDLLAYIKARRAECKGPGSGCLCQ